MDCQEIIQHELTVLRAAFNEYKAIPTHLVLIKDEQRFVLPFTFKDADHREIISQGMRDLVKNAMPDVVVFVSEAWESRFDPDAIRQGKLIRDSKTRQEIIYVQIEFKTGEKFGRRAGIKRARGKVFLSMFESYDVTTMAGRFMDFFPQTKN